MSSLIVVPCYNEATRLPVGRFYEFARSRPEIRFLFVNDGSSDATAGVLDDLAAVDRSRFLVRHLRTNSGKAEAVRHGVCEALRLQPEYVGYWDADLATPLEEIPRFIDVLERRADVRIVLGTRANLLGRKIERRPLRRMLGRLFARVASRSLGVSIFDTQCGAKLLRRTAAVEAAFAAPFCVRWIFDVELLARLAHLAEPNATGLASGVYELPLEQWRDVPGSKLKGRDFVNAIGELWRIHRQYRNAPIAVPLSAEVPLPVEPPLRRAA